MNKMNPIFTTFTKKKCVDDLDAYIDCLFNFSLSFTFWYSFNDHLKSGLCWINN